MSIQNNLIENVHNIYTTFADIKHALEEKGTYIEKETPVTRYAEMIRTLSSNEAPDAYNIEGVYDYFYLVFQKDIQPFSVGQFNDSVLMIGTKTLTATKVEQVNSNTYRIYVNLSNENLGIILGSRQNTSLMYANNTLVPTFSIFLTVEGLSIPITKYIFETTALSKKIFNTEDNGNIFLSSFSIIDIKNNKDICNLITTNFSAKDKAEIILTKEETT